ncbi:MAG: 16S rRNA (cytidine(1402)-2'-O)-methyltransferase [Bacteroidetes bacterium]|nr:16S rRNA (cytidine(1402)-2'-O)-methyltransferase [Bacteroidota bacterium]
MISTTGKLILVPTPIGNLGDMTFRAIEVMKNSDLILAEDSRNVRKLMSHFEIHAPVDSLHQNNEHRKVPAVIQEIQSGKTISYCSDAGTPGISDPGYLLIRECVRLNIKVECLPGATAFVPALVASGLPCDRFVYEGFLPHKKGRQKRLLALKEEERTVVLYESPHRIFRLLEELAEHFGDQRQIVVAREISKIHETYYRGSATEVAIQLENGVAKGEFVVIIGGVNASIYE